MAQIAVYSLWGFLFVVPYMVDFFFNTFGRSKGQSFMTDWYQARVSLRRELLKLGRADMLPLAYSTPRPEEHREVLTFTNQALLRDILAVSPQLAELGQLNDLLASQAAVRLAILNPHVEIDNVALARLLSHFFGSPSNPGGRGNGTSEVLF